MANIVQLKDSANAVFYPQTHEKAVVDSNGVNLQTKLQSITAPSYVVAWDGDSTPVVANIPAGVTVTYDDTDYTGTLAASASTTNKTYLVSTGTTDNYNRYVTQLNGSTYSWQPLGSTEIDLSDYATKAELGQLDQKVNLGDLILTNQTMNASTGAITSSDTSLLTSPIYGAAKLTLPDGFRFSRLCYYNISDNTFNSTSYINNATVNIAGVSGCYARVTIVTNPSGSNISPTDLKFSLLPEKFAEEDTRLEQKLIKLTGRGGDAAAAGATQIGDVFYNPTSKLLRERYTAGGSLRTIPFIKGAVYTMYGRLWVWNGSDLVQANEPVDNVAFDNIAKNIGVEFELEANTGTFVPVPNIIPVGQAVEVYIESYSSDAEGNVQLNAISSRANGGGTTYFGNMAQGATYKKVIEKSIEGFYLYPNPTTVSYKIKVKYGDSLVKNGLQNVADTQEAIFNSFYEKNEYDDSDLSAGWYNLSSTIAPTVTTQEPATWNCLRIPVKASDIVSIWTVGGGNARAWALTDINRTILTKADANADYSGSPAVLDVTADGYLYVNCKSANVADFKVEHLQNKISAEVNKVAAPCMFNPKIQLKKDNLRILDIGNSYTDDATHYLSDIIAAAGITTTGYSHYKAIRGGASFKTWVDCFNDQDTQTYNINRVSGDVISEVEVGTGEIGDGALFRTALAAGWDLILIHQVSNYANDYDAWQGQGAGGYLKELLRIIRQSNPNAAIGFLLVHSYATGYSGNTEGSSLLRWQNIALSAKKLVANYGIDFVIPYGTAVQNLRASTINTNKNDLSNDGTHLADGIGDYVAACCYFQMVYAPRFDKCILGNTFRKTDLDETSTGVLNIDNTNAPLAQKAALAAAYDWYTINNPDNM